jgi:hypothetical protein
VCAKWPAEVAVPLGLCALGKEQHKCGLDLAFAHKANRAWQIWCFLYSSHTPGRAADKSCLHKFLTNFSQPPTVQVSFDVSFGWSAIHLCGCVGIFLPCHNCAHARCLGPINPLPFPSAMHSCVCFLVVVVPCPFLFTIVPMHVVWVFPSHYHCRQQFTYVFASWLPSPLFTIVLMHIDWDLSSQWFAPSAIHLCGCFLGFLLRLIGTTLVGVRSGWFEPEGLVVCGTTSCSKVFAVMVWSPITRFSVRIVDASHEVMETTVTQLVITFLPQSSFSSM